MKRKRRSRRRGCTIAIALGVLLGLCSVCSRIGTGDDRREEVIPTATRAVLSTAVPTVDLSTATYTPTPLPTATMTSTPFPTNTPLPTATRAWDCSYTGYDCDSFSSCAEILSFFAACPNDPSNLDGNNDGEPCEARCF